MKQILGVRLVCVLAAMFVVYMYLALWVLFFMAEMLVR